MALTKDGVHFEGVFLKLRVFILGFFVPDSFRVSNPQRLTYTQILVEYSPPPLRMESFSFSIQFHTSRGMD